MPHWMEMANVLPNYGADVCVCVCVCVCVRVRVRVCVCASCLLPLLPYMKLACTYARAHTVVVLYEHEHPQSTPVPQSPLILGVFILVIIRKQSLCMRSKDWRRAFVAPARSPWPGSRRLRSTCQSFSRPLSSQYHQVPKPMAQCVVHAREGLASQAFECM